MHLGYIYYQAFWTLKYIFPGSELDHVGHTVEVMEANRFEIHDVENWREHYARTLKLWFQILSANKEKAIEIVGAERYRLWIAYLVGVHIGFLDGSLGIYQALASKHSGKGSAQMPPTRADLYYDAKRATPATVEVQSF